MKWDTEGERCTRYFFLSTKQRLSKSIISEIKDNNGTKLTDQNQISNHIVSYFENKFKQNDTVVDTELMAEIPRLIGEGENAKLEELPSNAEIMEAVFNLGPDSSPGPDGFIGYFYRFCWSIVGTDLCRAVHFSLPPTSQIPLMPPFWY